MHMNPLNFGCFAAFPVLETPRLILRQIELQDAPDLFATFSDDAVMRFYGEILHQTIDDSRELIRRQQHWYAEKAGIRWGITLRDEDRVIGSCGLYLFEEEARRAETGYELARAFWRQGIMREAMQAMLAYAFEVIGLHRIEAVVNDGNTTSQAFLTALGFTHEGTLRDRFWFQNRFWHEHFYGMLRSEWPKKYDA
jgi:[ribosomal protein S5]-alanine N-acetyltransferase